MSARIILDNRVRLDERALPPAAVEELIAAFTHKNPQREKLRSMGLPHWGEPKVIETWTRTRRGLSFPRGGLARVRVILARHGMPVDVTDARTVGTGPRNVPGHRVVLYPHQIDAVDTLVDRECCIARAPTGSGKSTFALALIARLKLPSLIVVWSGALFQQWQERVEKELGMRPKDIGIVRASTCRLAPVTIAMQQTIAARGAQQLRDYFGLVILDEVQRSAAGSVFAAIDPFPAKYRIGISADERRKDRKDVLIYDLFGDVAVDIKRGDLIESGHVLDVEVRVVPTAFEAPWFGFDKSGVARDDLDFDRLLSEMTADEDRDALAIRCVLDEVKAGEQVLLMSHRREHCQRLAEKVASAGVRVGLLIGGADYAKEFARAREGILGGALRVGVGTYQAVGTGVDLPRVGVAVCATPIAGNKQFFGQVRGRVCRVAQGKSGARLYYLWDRHIYSAHLRNLSSWNDQVLVLEDGKWHDARSWRPGVGTISEEVANAETKRSGWPESSERIAVGGRGARVPGVRR